MDVAIYCSGSAPLVTQLLFNNGSVLHVSIVVVFLPVFAKYLAKMNLPNCLPKNPPNKRFKIKGQSLPGFYETYTESVDGSHCDWEKTHFPHFWLFSFRVPVENT